jgi:hypothetical protein
MFMQKKNWQFCQLVLHRPLHRMISMPDISRAEKLTPYAMLDPFLGTTGSGLESPDTPRRLHMANSIKPPSGSAIGCQAPMHFIFTYDPGTPTTDKDVPVTFVCANKSVTFDPPNGTTNKNTGELAFTVTYNNVFEGVPIDIEVQPSAPPAADAGNAAAGTPYIKATYATLKITAGDLVLVPKSVPAAPTEGDLNTAPYTVTAYVKFTGSSGVDQANYPVTFNMQSNVSVYDTNGTLLDPDTDNNYYFYTGASGEPATFKLSGMFPGVFSASIGFGTPNVSSVNHFIITPEFQGGPQKGFDAWSPFDLDSSSGPLLYLNLDGELFKTPPVGEHSPVVALVNGKLASDVQTVAALTSETGMSIQKQVFTTGGANNLLSWMTTDVVSNITTQSTNSPLVVNGDTFLHPPNDGELPAPQLKGIGVINIPLIVAGPIPVDLSASNLNIGDQITLVYFLNGWVPGTTKQPEPKAASFTVEFTEDGTHTAYIPTANLGGYAADGTQAGTFELYYYMGIGQQPDDKSQYSQPLTPIPRLVTA